MSKTCYFASCGKKATRTGLCRNHNNEVNAGVKMSKGVKAPFGESCALKGCYRPAVSTTLLCEMHLSRFLIEGSVRKVLKMRNNPQTRSLK